MTLEYLKNTEVNIRNILVMTENFNIRNSNWNLFYPHYLTYNDILLEVANFFYLKFSTPVNQVLTQYADDSNNANLVIVLMFLWPDLDEINNHLILSEYRSLSDYASLIIVISIICEFIQDKWQTIIRNSKEKEEKFVTELINTIKNTNTIDISNKESLEEIIQEYARISDLI